jgi:hypothetical protein
MTVKPIAGPRQTELKAIEREKNVPYHPPLPETDTETGTGTGTGTETDN